VFERLTAIVLAAGKSRRMRTEVNKILLPLNGRPVLYYSLDTFQNSALVDDIVLVATPAERETLKARLMGTGIYSKLKAVVSGGAERSASVWQGLQGIPESCQWVAVHDGARPLFSPELLERLFTAARSSGAAVPALPLKDTVKVKGEDGLVRKTPPRDMLVAVQTPQVFRRDILLAAYRRALQDNWPITDDASAVEQAGGKVKLVEGEEENLKLTTPLDLNYAETILLKRQGRC